MYIHIYIYIYEGCINPPAKQYNGNRQLIKKKKVV